MLWNPRQVCNQFSLCITSLVTTRIYTLIYYNTFLFNSNIVDSLLNYENVKLYAAESFEGKKNEYIHSFMYLFSNVIII